jgi:mannosyltransferase OCH1-like enzyme
MNIWIYWENDIGKQKPAYLDLCLETIKKYQGAFDGVILLNEKTIHDYVELPFYWKDVECVAHKADYLRSRLVLKYGGLWLDSDTIVLQDLSYIINELEKYEFVGWGDDNGPYIGTFAAQKGSAILSEWANRQDKIFYKKKFGWAVLGTNILWELSKKYEYKHFPYEIIAPIGWKDWRRFLSNEERIEDVIKKDNRMITLYNNFMGTVLYNSSKEEILEADTLLSKIIKLSLSGGNRF